MTRRPRTRRGRFTHRLFIVEVAADEDELLPDEPELAALLQAEPWWVIDVVEDDTLSGNGRPDPRFQREDEER